MGIKELKTPYRAPRAHGICERFIGNLRRECLDHILIHDGGRLKRVVTEYTIYFNQDLPRPGIGHRIPGHCDLPISIPGERITSGAIPGGLHLLVRLVKLNPGKRLAQQVACLLAVNRLGQEKSLHVLAVHRLEFG